MEGEYLQSLCDEHATVTVKVEADSECEDLEVDDEQISQSRREVGREISSNDWWTLVEVEERPADPTQNSKKNEREHDFPHLDVVESSHAQKSSMNTLPKLRLRRVQPREQVGHLSDRTPQVPNRQVPGRDAREDSHPRDFIMEPVTHFTFPWPLPQDEVLHMNRRAERVPQRRICSGSSREDVLPHRNIMESVHQISHSQPLLEEEAFLTNQRMEGIPHRRILNGDAEVNAHFHDFNMESLSGHRLIQDREPGDLEDHRMEQMSYCRIPAQDAREHYRPPIGAQFGSQRPPAHLMKETHQSIQRTVGIPVHEHSRRNGRDLDNTVRLLHRVAERKNHAAGPVPCSIFPNLCASGNIVYANSHTDNVPSCRQGVAERKDTLPVPGLKDLQHPTFHPLGPSFLHGPIRFNGIGAIPSEQIDGNSEAMSQESQINFYNTKTGNAEVDSMYQAGTHRGYDPCRIEPGQDEPYCPRQMSKADGRADNAEDSLLSCRDVFVSADRANKTLRFGATHGQSSSENSDVAAMALEYMDLVAATNEGPSSESALLSPGSFLGLPSHALTMARNTTEENVMPDMTFPPILSRVRPSSAPLASRWVRLPPLISCALCRMKFTRPSHLMIHCRAVHRLHAKDCLPCSRCGLIFSSHEHLKRHVAAAHKVITKFACPKCSKLYTRRYHLKEHLENVHSDVKRNDCKVCGKRFAWKSGLRKHVDIVHGNKERVFCPVCNKTFTEKRSLKVHEATFHAQSISYECPHCDKSFRWKSSLKKHLNAAHNGGDKHLCPKCGQMFTEKGSLQAHLDRVHSDVQGYSCPECDKTFFWKSGVTKHIKAVHSNVRHACPVCKKKFTEKGSLKRHVLTLHDEEDWEEIDD